MSSRVFHFAIDRGGTFTDVFCEVCMAHLLFAVSMHTICNRKRTQIHSTRMHMAIRSNGRLRRDVERCVACLTNTIRKTLCICLQHRVLKLLSEDPSNYPDAPREGIRRVLEQETGIPHPRNQPLDTSRIASIRMGTTVCHDA